MGACKSLSVSPTKDRPHSIHKNRNSKRGLIRFFSKKSNKIKTATNKNHSSSMWWNSSTRISCLIYPELFRLALITNKEVPDSILQVYLVTLVKLSAWFLSGTSSSFKRLSACSGSLDSVQNYPNSYTKPYPDYFSCLVLSSSNRGVAPPLDSYPDFLTSLLKILRLWQIQTCVTA